MKLPAEPFNSRSRNRRMGARQTPARAERGYALLVIMIMATLLLISLTVALPRIYTEGRREREEELIFRGNEYARAIALFYRQFRRYPASVKELSQTNGIRFLRHEYPDPMTRKGKWRFIHADARGGLLDSKTQPTGFGRTAGQPQGNRTTANEPSRDNQETSAFFSNEAQGGFIVGVASTSRQESIRVLNGKSHYDEWEFLAISLTPGGLTQPGQPSAPSSPAAPSSAFGAAGPQRPQ